MESEAPVNEMSEHCPLSSMNLAASLTVTDVRLAKARHVTEK